MRFFSFHLVLYAFRDLSWATAKSEATPRYVISDRDEQIVKMYEAEESDDHVAYTSSRLRGKTRWSEAHQSPVR